MKTRKKFEQLKLQEHKANSDKKRAQIHKEFDQLLTEDPDGFEDTFIESARSTLHKARNLKNSYDNLSFN